MRALERGGRLGLCLLFFFCFALSRSAAKSLEKFPSLGSLELEAPVTRKTAEEMERREGEEERPAAFAAWAQKRAQTIENPGLSRSVQGEVILFAGDPSPLFSAGALPPLEGEEGCFLSETAAQELFGSSTPLGSMVEWNGQRLTVRGILPEGSPLLAARASDGEELGYVALRVPEGGEAQRVFGEFQARHGLSGLWSKPGDWAAAAELCSLLPAFALLFPAVFAFLKTAFAFSESPLVFLTGLLAAGALWFLLLWTTGFSFRPPLELLPAKWSDFGFWGDLFRQKREELLRFLASEKTCFHLTFLLPALKACGLGAVATVLLPFSLRRAAPKNGTALGWVCALLFGLAFLVSLWGNPGLARDRALWLCPAGSLAAAFFAERFSRWAQGLWQGLKNT